MATGRTRRQRKSPFPGLRLIRWPRWVRSGRVFHLAVLVLCLAVLTATFYLDVDRLADRGLGLRWRLYCFLNDVFGLESTSGGLIRSFSAIGRGRLHQAFTYHPLGPLLFGLTLFQVPYRLWALAAWPRAVPRPLRRVHAILVAVVCLAIIVDWLLLIGGRLS